MEIEEIEVVHHGVQQVRDGKRLCHVVGHFLGPR
jgi:hypothetical protein